MNTPVYALIQTRQYMTGLKTGLTLSTRVNYPTFAAASAALSRIGVESGVEMADVFGTADSYRTVAAYISAETK
jgi:hypothetical protein